MEEQDFELTASELRRAVAYYLERSGVKFTSANIVFGWDTEKREPYCRVTTNPKHPPQPALVPHPGPPQLRLVKDDE